MSIYVIAEYLRLSSEDVDLKNTQKTESNSISNQRDLLNAHLKKIPEFADAEVVEFCDDGWSGKNFERPAVQDMLAQVRQGKIQCVIVKDLSRLGRDYLTVENYISRIFPFLGVRFISVNDGIDSIRPMDVDNLDTSFRALLYDLYSRDLSRKVRSAQRQRAQRGDFVSRYAPYGYVKDPQNKNHLLIDPPAAEVVHRIFLMVGDGHSARQTAKALNRDCVLTPMLYKIAAGCTQKSWNNVQAENSWTDAAIIRVVRDERYLGKVIFGKRYYDIIGQKHSVKVSKKDWIITEHTHEAIVTQEEFDRAQAALKEYVERNVSSAYRPLRKKVRCGICGLAMMRVETKNPYFFCRASKWTDASPCAEVQISEHDLWEIILNGIHMRAALAVDASLVWDAQHHQDKRDPHAILKQISNLRDALDQQKHLTDQIYESFALGEIDKTKYISQRASIKEVINGLSDKIALLKAELESSSDGVRLQNPFVDAFKKYTAVQELTDEVVADVLTVIHIFPDHRVEIEWNYQDELQALITAGYLGGDWNGAEKSVDLLQSCVP